MISLIYNFKPRPLQISATSLLVLDVTKPSNYNDFSYITHGQLDWPSPAHSVIPKLYNYPIYTE